MTFPAHNRHFKQLFGTNVYGKRNPEAQSLAYVQILRSCSSQIIYVVVDRRLLKIGQKGSRKSML